MCRYSGIAPHWLFVACSLLLVSGSNAQTYPAKPIRWLVPSSETGAFDNVTRVLAPTLSAQMGQSLLVENRGGSAGLLGMEQAARAALPISDLDNGPPPLPGCDSGFDDLMPYAAAAFMT
ncbi:MAG: hypothetical protein EXR28_12490 [Betaproteobacteria bacterium]|nr:hypothetical protein [Betaproteobacteria bacterium]